MLNNNWNLTTDRWLLSNKTHGGQQSKTGAHFLCDSSHVQQSCLPKLQGNAPMGSWRISCTKHYTLPRFDLFYKPSSEWVYMELWKCDRGPAFTDSIECRSVNYCKLTRLIQIQLYRRKYEAELSHATEQLVSLDTELTSSFQHISRNWDLT